MFIARLRRKLGAAAIETVRGLGYRMAGEQTAPMKSLRGQVLLGAVLWTIGLMALWADRHHVPSAHRSASCYVVHAHPHGLMIGAALSHGRGLAVVRSGLAPFEEMRRRLADVQRGTARAARRAAIRPKCSRSCRT